MLCHGMHAPRLSSRCCYSLLARSCDHFSQDKDAAVSLGGTDGEYQMIIKDPEAEQEAGLTLSGARFGVIEVEADVRLEAGPRTNASSFGVGCWKSREPRAGYRVGLSGGGAFVMWADSPGEEHAGFRPEQVDEGGLQLGRSNHVRAACKSSGSATVVDMFVNGVHVGHARDPAGFQPFTAISLWGQSDDAGTDIRFDNVAVKEG